MTSSSCPLTLADRQSWLNFDEIYSGGHFGANGLSSGGRSEISLIDEISLTLPKLGEKLNARSTLDVQCGELNWIQSVDLGNVDCIGAVVVRQLIEKNQHRFSKCVGAVRGSKNQSRTFPKNRLTCAETPTAHLPLRDAKTTLKNLSESGAKRILATTFTSQVENIELLPSRKCRSINLEVEPLFPTPANCYIDEWFMERTGESLDKNLHVGHIH